MTTRFKQKDGSYLIPMELPESDDRQTMMTLARIKGYKIDWVRWGYRIFKAVLVPGTEEQFRAYIGEEDRRQKAARVDGRCPVPDGRGGVMRCPERLPNPEYNGEGDAKTIKNDCDTCVFYTLHKKDYSTAVFSDLEHDSMDEDGEEIPFEIPVGMLPEADVYEMAVKAILRMVKQKHPQRHDDIKLRLEEYNRKEVGEMLNKPSSSVYKLGIQLTRDILDVIEDLWFLTM